MNSTLRELVIEEYDDYFGNVDEEFTETERDFWVKLIQRKQLEARQSELEMFKKLPVTSIGKQVTQHISRRYKLLEAESKELKEE